jgi:hypothetical protein
MTGNERNTLTQFLRDLQQTRPLEVDAQANTLINEVMSSHPHAAYVLASRCILLEKELAKDSSAFLGTTLNDWSVNAQPVRQPFIAAVPGGNPNIPAHLLMEEKAINFLGNNALVVWICIIAFSSLVVYLRH